MTGNKKENWIGWEKETVAVDEEREKKLCKGDEIGIEKDQPVNVFVGSLLGYIKHNKWPVFGTFEVFKDHKAKSRVAYKQFLSVKLSSSQMWGLYVQQSRACC